VVAVRVVDRLEPVQIDEGDPGATVLGHGSPESCERGGPILQGRQLVVRGPPAQPAVTLLELGVEFRVDCATRQMRAENLQRLAVQDPPPGRDAQPLDELAIGTGGVILFADGLRLDVAQRLTHRLRDNTWNPTLTWRWAALPTVTATAKPAVSPVTMVIEGESLGEDFLPRTADAEQPLSTDRSRMAPAGYQYLGPGEVGETSGRAWTETGEIDKLGHSLQAKLAARVEEQVELLVERVQVLLAAGWREVRIVTDHGWLWLPGGLPKVNLPRHLTASRWARCAAIREGSTIDVPSASWYWNPLVRVAIGPGIACFTAGNEYAHGGLSLQEAVVPLIRVLPGADTRAPILIRRVSWAGLRCRVQVEATARGLSVDLRKQVNDRDSSARRAAAPRAAL